MLYDRGVKQRALEAIEKFGPAPVHYQIVQMAPHNASILELGCATGYVSELLKAQGCRVVGVELDEEAAQRARIPCEKVITGDAGDRAVLKQAGGPFDCVLCGDILEHLPDPPAVLSALLDMLKPGGYILVSLPNIAFWKMRWNLLCGKFDYAETGLLDWTHLRFYTVRSFRKMAHSCGYSIAKTEISDAGFPGSKTLEKIPGFRKSVSKLANAAARLWPNLFAFHSIYRLEPIQPVHSKGSPGSG